jgi:hypothetical protein
MELVFMIKYFAYRDSDMIYNYHNRYFLMGFNINIDKKIRNINQDFL